MLLTSFDANASPAAVVDVLRRDGGVIVRNLAPFELIDACAAELRSPLDEFDELIKSFLAPVTFSTFKALGQPTKC